MERGSRFQSGGYGSNEYFESAESEVYPFKKITYRESEQEQQQKLETDFPSSSAESSSPSFNESFTGTENISITTGETEQQQQAQEYQIIDREFEFELFSNQVTLIMNLNSHLYSWQVKLNQSLLTM